MTAEEANELEAMLGVGKHPHCWHMTASPMMIVMKDGYVHQTCCKCPETRSVHREHAHMSE